MARWSFYIVRPHPGFSSGISWRLKDILELFKWMAPYQFRMLKSMHPSVKPVGLLFGFSPSSHFALTHCYSADALETLGYVLEDCRKYRGSRVCGCK